ncbi:MAG TPA: dienelactone hydrolase family protein [Pseudobdellovibrionaceae bacterium]|jgi:putative phosphoribosyl transferase
MKSEKSELNKQEKEVMINYKDLRLNGILALPPAAQGIVIFAHGSGSSRWSTRNNFVARQLQKVGLGTLLMDLLLPEEEDERDNVFDIELLAERLISAKNWLKQQAPTRHLPVGYFGASTGAGAALFAAALQPQNIFSVVSRGGRPDLAGAKLSHVQAPTLLIVGGEDTIVIDLNKQAYSHLNCKKKLEIIPGATHLFEEPGTLGQVANLASNWFTKYLEAQEIPIIPNP